MVNLFQKKSISTLLVLAAITFTLITTSCKKENTSEVLTDDKKVELTEQSLQTNMFLTSAFTQIPFATVKVFGLKEGNNTPLQVRGACTTPSVFPMDLTTYPKTVTSDFGAGCTDAEGKTKSGKITLTINTPLEPGATIKATFDNYSQDGATLNGTFTIINNGVLGMINLTLIGENIKMTDKNGKTFTYNIRQTHRQVGGAFNMTLLDDVYEITTTMTATLPDGTLMNWDTTLALTKTNVCYWVQKGTGILKLNGLPMLVDFGDGTCDNDATVTLGALVRHIKL